MKIDTDIDTLTARLRRGTRAEDVDSNNCWLIADTDSAWQKVGIKEPALLLIKGGLIVGFLTRENLADVLAGMHLLEMKRVSNSQ